MDEHAGADVVLFGGFRFDRRRALLPRQNEDGGFVPIAIGSRALDLLGLLIDRHGDLVSREEILNAVWPGVVEGANVTVQISTLRRVLDEGRSGRTLIQTIPGRGYRLAAAITRCEAEPLPTAVLQGTVAPRLSIVVLPFANLGNDPEQQYFADGITEDLTTDLSRIAGMLVISGNTAFTYRNKPVDTKQIGRELGVRYVLEGSVRRLGNRIRVNAQLIDSETDAHLWADRFDGDTSNLFALQDEITSRIAVALNTELVGAEAARPTAHPDALDYILRARAITFNQQLTRDNYLKAISLYERALALDPRSVEAQSRLASALTGRIIDDMTDSRAADVARAEELSSSAFAVSPRSGLALYAKGSVLRVRHRPEDAIPYFEAVISLDRNLVGAHSHLIWCKLLTGPIEEIIPLVEQIIRLSPRDHRLAVWHYWIGRVHLLQSRTEKAIFWLEKAHGTNPELAFVHAYLASGCALIGEIERAAAELAEAQKLSTDGRYSSIARLKAMQYFGVPKIRKLFEATYFAGLRKAGMPET